MTRIAFDAKRIFHNFTGLGNYGRTLVRNLQAHFPEHSYQLFTPQFTSSSETTYFEAKDRFDLIVPHAARGSLWRTYGMTSELEKHQVQLYHGLSNELPANLRKTKIKTVLSLHDLIFKTHPEQYPFIDRLIYDWKFKRSCKDADVVVAISESTKKDVMELYQIPEAKIQVVYQSCGQAFYQGEISEAVRAGIRAKHGLPKEYLLYVGTVNERKNLLRIVQALNLSSSDCPLVVVGRGGEYERKVREYIRQEKMESRVFWAQAVTNDELPGVYQGATAFLFPSLYEGFGIPVIEALVSGVPVITSSLSSLPEAGGPFSVYVNPLEVEEIAMAIQLVLTDAGLRKEMSTQGKLYAERFSGENISREWMDLYKKVLGSDL